MLRGAEALATPAPPSKERGITSDLSVDEALLLHAAGGAARPHLRSGRGVGPRRGVELGERRHRARLGRPRRRRRPGLAVAAQRVREGARSLSACGSRCRCGRTTSTSNWWGRRCDPSTARTPGRRRRPGHAVRIGPLCPRLHAAATCGLDARRPRLRCQLRVRPATLRRHRDENRRRRTSS